MKLNFLLELIMSLIKILDIKGPTIEILNIKGPTIEPCGTPVLIVSMDDFTSSIFTYCFLSDK